MTVIDCPDILQIEVKKMADYKEMYLHLMRETDKAIELLIQAQRDCEEMYVSAPETKLAVLDQEKPAD